MSITRFMNPHGNQGGAALIITLVILTILTLLSISAMQDTNLDTKIAINHQFKEMSFRAAENALAIVTGPELSILDNLDIPNVVGEITHADPFFTTHDAIGDPIDHAFTDQLPMRASLTVEYQGKREGLFFSGHQLDNTTHLFLVDAIGTVGESATHTQNRMQVGLIRQRH
ncbi:MAG: PilX N-terminal domain-containing pilus assembly protein [Candidatus Thiodiazotropha sp.]